MFEKYFFLLMIGIFATAHGKANITIQEFRVDLKGERIVGGTVTSPNEFPWYVLLTTRTRQQFCGGTILSEEFVLTATHCMVLDKSNFFVVAGAHSRLITIDGTEQYARVEEIFNHPDYIALPMEHDVSILRINPPFKFNQYVGPIALPTSDSVPIDTVTAVGWGNTNYTLANGSFTPAPFLKKLSLTLQTTEHCSKMYEEVSWGPGIPSKITDRMYCAGSPREMESVCQGDSGGGLRCEDKNGKEFVCGIASFLAGCGFSRYASVYTKVQHYIDFIRSRTGLYENGQSGQSYGSPINVYIIVWCTLISIVIRTFK